MSKKAVPITILLFLALTIQVPQVEMQTLPTTDQQTTDQQTQAVAQRPCKDFTDKNGRKWRARTNVPFAKEPEPGEKARWERPKRENVLKPPRQMTDAELARAMRPVALSDKCEYVSDPDTRVAQLARRNIDRIMTFRGSRGSIGGKEEAEKVPIPKRVKGQKQQDDPQNIIIGTDQREKRRDNTSYPMRTQVLLSNQNGGGRCSGTMIGPSTMITAAHCVHDSNNWLATKTWSPGVDSEDTVDFPYNPFSGGYPSNNASNTAIFQCYWVTIPGGYLDGGDDEWDFAVIEFAGGYNNCNLSPGNTVGWLGWGSQSNATIENNINYIYGYPAGGTTPKCGVVSSTCGGGSCNWPQIWGWGRSDFEADGDSIEHRVDTSSGQSGSGIYNMAQGFRKVIGIHLGCESSTENRGRRIDGTVIDFVKAHSAL
jgi:V8-like Glu-specific endopeptidase